MAKGFQHSKVPAGYEKSRFDKDMGVKEGSPADIARDKKGVAAFNKAKGGGAPMFRKGGRAKR